MSFNSLDFAVFFVIFWLIYWILRSPRQQNIWILAGSYVFYGWVSPWFVLILFVTTCLDYSSARLMWNSSIDRKALLAVSIASNLLVLFVFKSNNFFFAELSKFLASIGVTTGLETLKIMVPVGLSFYTFQSMSFTIDAYRKKQKLDANFLDFSVFVAFFPQLLAGPIERWHHMAPQIRRLRKLEFNSVITGLFFILLGYYKKLVVADSLAEFSRPVFDSSALLIPAGDVVIGVVSAIIEIYCDFSGYSDIARGTARLLGFELSQNFRNPFFATSAQEFWRRWHITLNAWFRDYVFYPLTRVLRQRMLLPRAVAPLALVVTILLMAIWHGLQWHYLVWGALHAGIFILYNLLFKAYPDLRQPGTRLLRTSFTIIWLLLWYATGIVFRSPDLPRALVLFELHGNSWIDSDIFRWISVVFLFAPILTLERMQESKGEFFWRRWGIIAQTILLTILLWGILLLSHGTTERYFYFDF